MFHLFYVYGFQSMYNIINLRIPPEWDMVANSFGPDHAARYRLIFENQASSSNDRYRQMKQKQRQERYEQEEEHRQGRMQFQKQYIQENVRCCCAYCCFNILLCIGILSLLFTSVVIGCFGYFLALNAVRRYIAQSHLLRLWKNAPWISLQGRVVGKEKIQDPITGATEYEITVMFHYPNHEHHDIGSAAGADNTNTIICNDSMAVATVELKREETELEPLPSPLPSPSMCPKQVSFSTIDQGSKFLYYTFKEGDFIDLLYYPGETNNPCNESPPPPPSSGGGEGVPGVIPSIMATRKIREWRRSCLFLCPISIFVGLLFYFSAGWLLYWFLFISPPPEQYNHIHTMAPSGNISGFELTSTLSPSTEEEYNSKVDDGYMTWNDYEFTPIPWSIILAVQIIPILLLLPSEYLHNIYEIQHIIPAQLVKSPSKFVTPLDYWRRTWHMFGGDIDRDDPSFGGYWKRKAMAFNYVIGSMVAFVVGFFFGGVFLLCGLWYAMKWWYYQHSWVQFLVSLPQHTTNNNSNIDFPTTMYQPQQGDDDSRTITTATMTTTTAAATATTTTATLETVRGRVGPALGRTLMNDKVVSVTTKISFDYNGRTWETPVCNCPWQLYRLSSHFARQGRAGPVRIVLLKEGRPESGIPDFQMKQMIESSKRAKFLWHPILALIGIFGYLGLLWAFWRYNDHQILWYTIGIAIAPILVIPQMRLYLKCRSQRDPIDLLHRCSVVTTSSSPPHEESIIIDGMPLATETPSIVANNRYAGNTNINTSLGNRSMGTGTEATDVESLVTMTSRAV